MKRLALCLLLTGCATTQRPLPTPVACVAPADIPPEPEQVRDRLTGNAQADVGIIAVSALELRIWGRGLRALLEGCQ